MSDPVQAIAFYVVFVLAVTFHEAAHAWVAKLGGDLTAYRGGQVSLDPLPHMRREPFGMVIVPVFSVALSGWPIGWASAPYDPGWARRHPRRAAWMALAGPGANLALVVVTGLAVRAGLATGLFEIPTSISFTRITAPAADAGGVAVGLALLASLFFSMNLLLFVLNMIPLPPLDGSGALPLLLPEAWLEGYRTILQQPIFSLIGLLIVWHAIGEIFAPLLFGAIGLLYPEVRYG